MWGSIGLRRWAQALNQDDVRSVAIVHRSRAMNILVIDNDDTILQIICLMLRTSNHRVMATTEVRAALDVIEHSPVDLLITDVEMPVMRGPELVTAARRLRPGLPVLFISGAEPPSDDPFLPKPFEADELLTAIEAAAGSGVALPVGGV